MKRIATGFGLALAFGLASVPAFGQTDQQTDINFSQFDDQQKQEFCANVRGVTDQLTKQLPIEIDPTTTLFSATTLYVQGECLVTYQYSLDEQELFSSLQSFLSQQNGEEVPMDFVQQWYGDGGEGLEQLKKTQRQNFLADKNFAQLVSVPFVQTEIIYQVQGQHMPNYSLSLGTK